MLLGAIVKGSDSQSKGLEFDSRPLHCA